jgi:hypothetical protein
MANRRCLRCGDWIIDGASNYMLAENNSVSGSGLDLEGLMEAGRICRGCLSETANWVSEQNACSPDFEQMELIEMVGDEEVRPHPDLVAVFVYEKVYL